MGLLMVILLSFLFVVFYLKTANAATFDVTHYGAIGDGDADDTKAFVRAWEDLCGDTSMDPTLIVPSMKTFLISCVTFSGPCQSSSVRIKLLGDITAPKNVDGWKGCETTGYLMHFTSVQGLIIEGPGQLDGQGSIWWPKEVDIKVFKVNHHLGLLMIVYLIIFNYISFCTLTTSANVFDVMHYGAKGDGITDDTKAFIRAWAGLCGVKSRNPVLVIPPRKWFLISPVTFNGPCKSPAVHVQLLGNIVAPKTLHGWKGCVKNRAWINFTFVRGLTINESGQINGRGSIWWRNKALHFNDCNNLRLNGTTHIDSPSLHISIVNCQHVDIGNLRILAPEDSPNTDGIDLSTSSHINIHDSNIHTGDDCVAINGGIYDINVTRVFCGPGHGISIGSLGENHGHDTVEKVRVQSCNITGTTNGLRIKTVPGGTGYAKGIIFQDIRLVNVKNPIIIDQHYCTNAENYVCPAPVSDDCVAINGGVVDINVTNVFCGPGHGISIGSLGEKEGHDTVEQVLVQNCNITGTRNGLRIKTVPNGTGYARGITFKDISLVNVGNPIIIDQYYCSSSVNAASTQAVRVSDVTYANIYGSTATNKAIIFKCSEVYKCTNIVTNNVHITGGDSLAYCKNAQGEFVDTAPSVNCD
ncbi:hypothetical protein R6Q57_023688 [Mikania cordata]